ncbi:MAG TPA: tyramine oxidase [Bradyrhizobium sp.]|nr:tyramine oxidase [Bradyrhizobium sp.]
MRSNNRAICSAVVLLLSSFVPAPAEERVGAPSRAAHPMDALTAGEISAAAGILRAAGKLDGGARIVSLAMEENPKAEVVSWTSGKPFARRAFAVVLTDGKIGEATIDLDRQALSSWNLIANRQAAVTFDEFLSVENIAKADQRWREAMGRRGITNLQDVLCFPLTAGPSPEPALAGRRLLNVPCVDRSGTGNNLWGKPIENVMAVVDVAAGKVVSVTDLGVLPLPPETPSHAWKDSGQARPIAKPVEIAAPQGSNVSVSGGEVRWDNWSFHVRIDPRLGSILSLIRYNDRGATRDVAYQISASEMFVPYMDAAPTWSFRAYMDIGEYGFGGLATQLRPGQDCPANATFLDLTIADTKGEPVALKGVVCLFERATGDPLWRHDEFANNTYEMRANNDLVVRMAPVVGNYDYLIDYVFDRAGNIDVRLGAYGIDATKGVASSTLADPTAAADTAHGTLVAKRLLAVNHDHYMAFRIDMDVDGTENRLVEDRIVPRRISQDGPRRSLWQVECRAVAVEGPVTTPLNAAQFRIESTARKNAQGYPTSYQLMPGHSDVSILAPDDPIQVRAGFSAYTLWSSAYAPNERYAAGAYPNGNPEADGLPKWTAARRPINGRDLVLWYTVGFRHVPRAEDWPVMPGLWHGFRLRPFNFFDRSPALDVPPVEAAAK